MLNQKIVLLVLILVASVKSGQWGETDLVYARSQRILVQDTGTKGNTAKIQIPNPSYNYEIFAGFNNLIIQQNEPSYGQAIKINKTNGEYFIYFVKTSIGSNTEYYVSYLMINSDKINNEAYYSYHIIFDQSQQTNPIHSCSTFCETIITLPNYFSGIIKAIQFVQIFYCLLNIQQFNFRVRTQINTQQNTAKVTSFIGNFNKMDHFEVKILFLNLNYLQKQYSLFFNIGSINGQYNTLPIFSLPPSQRTNNYIYVISQIAVINIINYFKIQFIPLTTAEIYGNFLFFSLNYINIRSCGQNYFYNNTTCTNSCAFGFYGNDEFKKCLTCDTKCLTCNSNDTCTTCDSTQNRISNNNQCPCKSGYFDPHLESSEVCESCLSACSLCYNAYECQICQSFFTDTSQQYFLFNSSCFTCKQLIYGCIECLNSSTCLKCSPNKVFIAQQNRCVCFSNYFLNGQHCEICDISCLTCSGSSTNCLSCNNTALRVLNNNKCECIFPFSDCRDSDIIQCQKHTCSYLAETQIKIQSLIKNPSNNTLIFSISLNPISNDLIVKAIQVFELTLPYSNISFTHQNGQIKVFANYTENVQGLMAKIKLDLKQTNLWFFSLSQAKSLDYQILPSNNLAANVYSQELYQQRNQLEKIVIGISIFSIIIFLIGLGSERIVVVEMMAVLQVSFLGLFIVNFTDPLMNPIVSFSINHGFNNIVNYSQYFTPTRLHSTGLTSAISTNLNIILLILIIPCILSLIFLFIHKKSTQYRIRMQKLTRLMLGQMLFTAFILILYNYSSSFMAFVLYTPKQGTQFIISIVECIILSGIFAYLLWAFIKKDDIWMGQYKSKFNWNNFSQLYYLIPISQRLLVGIILTAGNPSFASAIICILLFIANIIIIAIKKPFVQNYHNIRSILTNIFSIVILSNYIAISCQGTSKGVSSYTYIPYVIVTFVCLNSIMGTFFVIFGQKQKQCMNSQLIQSQLNKDMTRRMNLVIQQTKKNFMRQKLARQKLKKSSNVQDKQQILDITI